MQIYLHISFFFCNFAADFLENTLKSIHILLNMEKKKRVYTFGNGKAEGNAQMRELLGGKGANCAEMNLVGVPVPPGFTITTEVCNEYYQVGQEKIVAELTEEVNAAVAHVEGLMNCKFGDP